ncbi:MAG: kpsD 2, partial [Acidobacteria bacterium]|nr:kpsD 2 [Acidobacteriota bacterium]
TQAVQGGTAQNQAAASPQKIPDTAAPETFVIGLEDVLRVDVWREAELSAPQIVVRPDGKITLPLIGDVQAAGFTTKQLQDNLTERFKEFAQAPTVSVMVLKIESQRVSIVGNVSKPGTYPLGSPLTVLELIARAGGLTEYANTKNIKIVRKKDGTTLNFNYKDAIKGKNLKQNVYLENGDIVMVP